MMTVAALATETDVAARLGRPLTADEDTAVDGLCEEASVLVQAWIGAVADPVPAGVRIVTSRVVARALQAAESGAPIDGASSVQATALAFSYTRSYPAASSAGGVWLTRQDKIMLRPFRRRGTVINVATA